MFGLGMQEILIIALIVLLFYGGKKIPELMKGLGKGVKSFKDGMNEVTDLKEDKKEDIKEEKKETSCAQLSSGSSSLLGWQLWWHSV